MSLSTSLDSTLSKTSCYPQWKRIGIKHHHGINIPLFSLNSQESCGIGEFYDLLPLIPWCQKHRIDSIQLLPLNDTGFETSPYNALSAFALNPLHLQITKLPGIEKHAELTKNIQELQSLCLSEHIDYKRLIPLKKQSIYSYAKKELPQFSYDGHFQQFKEQNDWLPSYGLFLALKQVNGWQSWQDWPQEQQRPSPTLFSQYSKEIEVHSLIQYLCFSQMDEVKTLCEKHHISLKGDLPILISKESVDVWTHQDLFHLNLSAGAPGDMYAQEGQNWGFPLYKWDVLESHDYSWWKKRLKVADKLYHLIRIDHIVGFFRIWGIPLGHGALEGKFFPENEDLWIPQGKKFLDMMLSSCELLPIGEDLGVVPDSVRDALKSLGICGTKIMRWERDWNNGSTFIPYDQYLPQSLTSVSTHDSEPVRLWWESFPEDAKAYASFKNWEYQPTLSLDRQREILYDSHRTQSLFHINLLGEYLSLVQSFREEDPLQERINTPGIISEKNWSHCFIPSVEEIVQDPMLSQLFKELIPAQ